MIRALDAIKYGLETLNVTPKELFSLIESSKGYDGEDYGRWLANEIIKIAENDEVGHSLLLAKWFNIIQSIVEEYSDDSVRECYELKVKELLGDSKVYCVGFNEGNSFGKELSTDIEWGNGVDLPFNYYFLESLPEELSSDMFDNRDITIFVKFNPKDSFKKSCDLVSDAKLNGVSVCNYASMMLYRMCTIVRALEDKASNFSFAFMCDTKFLYSKENSSVIKYFLSFFNYSGFVVNSKDLYKGSFTSEQYAFCKCRVRTNDDEVQDGFVLDTVIEAENAEGDRVIKVVDRRRYSEGKNMLSVLMGGSAGYTDKVPLIDRHFNVIGVTRGLKHAYGYLCKGLVDKYPILTNYPMGTQSEGSNYVAITNDNLFSIIAYFGVMRSMGNVGMSYDIDEIIDGHPDFMNLVSNCLPIFLFDTNSLFCDMGSLKLKNGKVIDLVNAFDVKNSSLVANLLDKCSVYFSYEAKELMDICKGLIDSYYENFSKDNRVNGITFNEIRHLAENVDLNKEYLLALTKCNDYVCSIYRAM